MLQWYTGTVHGLPVLCEGTTVEESGFRCFIFLIISIIACFPILVLTQPSLI